MNRQESAKVIKKIAIELVTSTDLIGPRAKLVEEISNELLKISEKT